MNSAIIVAAGRGTRMDNPDKLFLPLAGRPLVAHTWQRFEEADCVHEIILVVRDGTQPAFGAVADQGRFRKPYRLVPGGPERQDSVWNGIAALHPDSEIVAIHDGARPCAGRELIAATVAAAAEAGAAVAAQRVTDTLKESADGLFIARTIDRARLWAVQTPQTFRVAVIRRAMAAVREQGRHVTDDTAACELIGQPIKLVEVRTPNPKATRPEDLPYLEWLLDQA